MGILVLTLLVAIGAFGQDGAGDGSSHSTGTGPSNVFIFVSPNTSKGLTLNAAVHNLRGPAEVGLILSARDLLCRLSTTGRLTPVIGSWADGAEHSMMIRGRLDQDKARYVSSALGNMAHQKSVLYFIPKSGGPATFYVLKIRNRNIGLRSISAALEKNGVAFRTIAPSHNWMIVYVVDLKGDLGNIIRASASQLHASISTMEGVSEFVGSEASLKEAEQAYNEVIKEIETRLPQVKGPCRIKNLIKGN